MIRRLILENFMAHRLTEIELGPGLTVLTGPNNSGKSAVVEGLRCLATNPAPKSFIRHGADRARVEVEFDDGVRVRWLRKATSAGYEIDRPGHETEEIYKFGRKPPEQVLEILGLNMVELDEGKDDVDVHLGDQRKPIFLLDQPGSTLAAFFAASSESAHLLEMQRALKSRERDARSEEKQTLASLNRVEGELDLLADLPRVQLVMEQASALHDARQRLAATIPHLETTAARLTEISSRRVLAAAREKSLRPLAAPTPLWPTGNLARHLAARGKLQSGIRLVGERRAVLEPLAAPGRLHPTRELAGAIATMARLRNNLVRADARRQALAPLAAPTDLFDTATLARRLETRQRLDRRRAMLDLTAKRCHALVNPPNLSDPGPLASLCARLEAWRSRVAEARKRAEASGAGLKEFRKQLERRLAEAGACPLCGAELTVESFLEGGHVHEP